MTYRIMAHLVAFYPNREASIEVARALVAGGCSYLELQFPFSDPLADGPVIQQACGRALEAGFRTEEGFRLLGQIREIAEVPIFLMSYVNLVFSCGMGEFLRRAKDAGASGLIVPDLPMDSDEGLYDLGHALGLSVVPVVPPGIRSDRIKLVDEKRPDFLYVALRKGITGRSTEIGEENLTFLETVRRPGRKLLAGFGLSRREQVARLAPHVHAAVVGSAFIREISRGEDLGKIYAGVSGKMRELAG
jgi:tryptophan synthase alpha chain